VRTARAVVALVVVVTIASIVVALRLRLSGDLTELFPATPEASALARVTRVFGGGDVSLVLVRGDDPAEVEKAAERAADFLRSSPAIEQVVTAPPAPSTLSRTDPTGAWRFAGPVARRKLARALTDDGMRERLRDTHALLLAPGAGEVADWLARDPLRLAAIPFEDRIELASGARAAPGSAFVADGGRARLIVLVPRGRAFDPSAARTLTESTSIALADAHAEHPGVRFDLTGGHVVASQTEALVRADLTRSGLLSMALASFVFVALFRRPRALVAVLPPLVAGTLWTTAIAALAYPRLSAIATAFAAVVIGVGVDTGVHVYGKLLAARREGRSPADAAAFARRETWRPTLGAAVAAGAAFACIGLSDVEGMRQLGVLCGAGEVATALAILAVVPKVGGWLERGPPPRELRLSFVAALTSTRPRALAALAASAIALAAALAYGTPRLDHAVVALGPERLPAMATCAEIGSARARRCRRGGGRSPPGARRHRGLRRPRDGRSVPRGAARAARRARSPRPAIAPSVARAAARRGRLRDRSVRGGAGRLPAPHARRRRRAG
jgi:predicted exporter